MLEDCWHIARRLLAQKLNDQYYLIKHAPLNLVVTSILSSLLQLFAVSVFVSDVGCPSYAGKMQEIVPEQEVRKQIDRKTNQKSDSFLAIFSFILSPYHEVDSR